MNAKRYFLAMFVALSILSAISVLPKRLENTFLNFWSYLVNTVASPRKTDVLIVDTAGRLHVKANLMEELKKMDRVIEREYPEAQVLKFIVLDSTTGQNSYSQVEAFTDAIGIDGIVLTKFDGTAKGGFVVSLSKELEVPVVYVGVGEKIDDLEDFKPQEFVDAQIGRASCRERV